MTVTELLARFSDPQVIQSLSVSDKLFAGLITTILGMGITFTALILLQFIIPWMDKLLNRSTVTAAPKKETTPPASKADPTPPQKAPGNDQELVAVIATAIAMKLKTSTDRIVIRNVEKVADNSSTWSQAGIVEQMNNRM